MTKLEIHLYQSLKALLPGYEPMNKEMSHFLRVAESAVAEVEMDLGPLPDWATAHNMSRAPVQYAQLCTRDGQRMGNAIIANIPNDMSHVYYVITDMGNPMRLSEGELEYLFTVGPYIMDESAVLKRKRQNPEMFGEELLHGEPVEFMGI